MNNEVIMKREYWEERWNKGETGWDIGYASPPLIEYAMQLEDKNKKILIPGAGNAYEAEFLWKNGFKNIYVLDISKTAAGRFLERCPEFPKQQVIVEDFFQHNDQYDLILEQTFFCALPPSCREKYVEKVYSLLKRKGKIAGVLFNCEFEVNPPFGGSKQEYLSLFSKKFTIKTMETCRNSIKPRMGRELFFIAEKN